MGKTYVNFNWDEKGRTSGSNVLTWYQLNQLRSERKLLITDKLKPLGKCIVMQLSNKRTSGEILTFRKSHHTVFMLMISLLMR